MTRREYCQPVRYGAAGTVAAVFAEPGQSVSAASAAAPLGVIPALSSRPSAPAKLYLDFDGEPASFWSGQAVPATSAYSRDSDPRTFSDADLSAIREVFDRVAEKFSPFNLNVTTVNPGSFQNRQAVRVVIGGDGDWAGRSGGTAYVGAFYNAAPNTVYVFEDNLASEPRIVAEAASHEAGHAFGLEHQGDYSGATKVGEYNSGTRGAAPVMGRSYSATRGLWWKGPSSAYDLTQDDLAQIAGPDNGFGYRADDHGSGPGSATKLAVSGRSVSGTGVIEKAADADYFSFTTPASAVSLKASVMARGATLDAKLELRTSGGGLVASAATANLGESLTATVSAGSYRVVVRSQGGYGDVGQYKISGTLPSAPSETSAGSVTGLKFNDVNANGVRDASEPGLTNRRIYVDADRDGAFDPGEKSALTDGAGEYTLGGLAVGAYRVRDVPQSGWRRTKPSAGYYDVNVGGASPVGGFDFGDTQKALVSGTVFNDLNASGGKATSEPGLSGWRVYVDADKDGALDAGEANTLSDGAGNYRFVLSPGTHSIRQLPRTGWRRTQPAGVAHGVTLSGGATAAKRDFGYTQKALISGAVFNDADGDKVKDGGESGLSGWRVFIDSDAEGAWDSAERSVLSDGSGNWAFKDLSPGSYRVRVVPQPGWSRTTPTAGYHALTLSAGQTAASKLFGQRRAT